MARFLLTLILATVVFSSCNRKVSLSKIKDVKAKDIAIILDTSAIRFEEMKARFKIKADLNGDSRSFTADVRWDRNDKIWMSFSIFGIEGVRAMFTRDSVKVINRLDRDYYYGTYEGIERLSQVKLSFDEIEQLLLGSLVGIRDKKPNVKFGKDNLVLDLKDDEYYGQATLDLSTVSIQHFWINSIGAERRLEVNLSDYELIQGKPWPNVRDYYIITGDTYLKVDATAQKMILNEALEYPFTVNSKYEWIRL